jgi:hypothetical protein
MIRIGENTWELLRRYSMEIGIVALNNAAQRAVAEDQHGENEWRKVVVRADVITAILQPIKRKPHDDQVSGVWEFDDEPIS